jgi:hypothetical protein
MVIHDFDALGTVVAPYEADAPLVIDPDAVLAGALATQQFQPIAGWRRQVAQLLSLVKLQQLALGNTLHIVGEATREPPMKQRLCIPISERADHSPRLYTQRVLNVKRI